MRFASPRGIVALTLAWALFLHAAEFVLVPRTSRDAAPVPPGGARIRLAVRHLCCSGCSSDLVEAVREAIPAEVHVVTPQLPSIEQADAAPAAASFGGAVLLDLKDLTQVDFARLDARIRAGGLVPERMEIVLPAPAHLRLEAALPHLCCQQCDTAADTELEALRPAVRWLDSVQVDRTRKVVTGYAGYLEAQEPLDALEFLRALDDAGFHPEALHVRGGD